MKSIGFGIYVENTVTQGDNEKDWVKISDTKINFIPKEIRMLDEYSDENTLTSLDEISNGDNILIADSDNNIFHHEVSSVDVEDEKTVDIVDIFGDGNGLALYQFEDNCDDKSGNYNGTANGSIEYDNGFYGKGIVIREDKDAPDDQYVSVDGGIDGTDSGFGWSAFIKGVEDSGTYMYCLQDSQNDNIYGISINFDEDDESNKITPRLRGTSKTYSLNNTLSRTDEFFVAYSWEVGKNNSKPNLYIKNITKDWELYVDEVDIQSTDKLDEPITIVAGIIHKYGDRTKCLWDNVRVFNRFLTEEEMKILANEKITVYKEDISELGLSEKPTKAFYKQNYPEVLVSLESSSDRIFPLITEQQCVIDSSSDSDTLVLSGRIYNNEELVIDENEFIVSGATYDADNDLTTIDISSLELTDTPKFVFRKGFLELSKEDSSTTSFVGTNEYEVQCDVGDYVVLDEQLVQLTDVTIEYDDDNSVWRYTFGFDELDNAPNSCFIQQRTKLLQKDLSSIIFDGNVFSISYNELVKTGRVLQRRILISDVDMQIIEPFESQMWKENE